MNDEQITAEATPAGELRRQILSQCVAKSEREWWAASAIERLEFELNAASDRIQSLIEERDRANRLAEWKWNLRDEFQLLLGTDKIEEGIEAVKELKRRIKRLEDALSFVTVDCGNLHHGKKHRHKYGEPCPVVELIEKAKEAKP